MAVRNRVSVTLSDVELLEIQKLSELLGVKSSRCVYDAMKLGMPQLLKNAHESIRSAQALDWNLKNMK